MLRNRPFIHRSTSTEHACLLLHGLGGGVYELQLLGEYLHHRLGLTVQGISYPGHDRPASRMPASTWQQWYAHIVETYQALAQTYQSVSVIGFSTGCPLGLHLAATHPIEKLVLLCPYLAIRRQWYYLLPLEALIFSLGWLIEDVPRLRLPIRDPAMRSLAEEVMFYKTFNLAAVRSAIELIEQVKTELPQVHAPTLILQAGHDTLVDPAGAEYIYQHLGSRVKTLQWLWESDHIIPLDQEREVVFAQVGKFLQN